MNFALGFYAKVLNTICTEVLSITTLMYTAHLCTKYLKFL